MMVGGASAVGGALAWVMRKTTIAPSWAFRSTLLMMINGKKTRVITPGGKAQMGIGVTGQLEVRVGGDPAGQIGIALDPFPRQRTTSQQLRRRGGDVSRSLISVVIRLMTSVKPPRTQYTLAA
jgi:hypothetical protein